MKRILKGDNAVFSMKFGGRASRFVDRFRETRSFRGHGFLPVLRMRLGNAELIGVSKTVKDPTRYGGVFRSGEKILEVHVTNLGKDTTKLIGRFGESFDELKRRGFVGFVGHTPSRPIGERFKAGCGMQEIPTTIEVEREVRDYIFTYVEAGEYPSKLLFSPVMSIVKRL